jgi:hypothetical protein
MPQQSAPGAARQKTTKVQKILKDEGLRQSVEVTWQRERSQTDGLEVLARCKALNEFIRKVRHAAVCTVCTSLTM